MCEMLRTKSSYIGFVRRFMKLMPTKHLVLAN